MSKWILKLVLVFAAGAAGAEEYLVRGDLPFFGFSGIQRELKFSKAKVVDLSVTQAEYLKRMGLKVEINQRFQIQPLAIGPTPSPTPYYLTAINSKTANQLPHGTGFGVRVCVVDTGVNAGLPEFTGVPIDGVNVTDKGGPTEYGDVWDHGTGLAGLIHEVAPDASIYAVRVFPDGSGGTSTVDAVEGIYACIGKTDVINISWGSFQDSPAIKSAIDQAIAAGLTVIAAVGNEGYNDVAFPARYAPVIAIGGADKNLKLADFSSYGPDMDFLAPAEEISVIASGGGTAVRNGNSFAAALASGVEAVRRSRGAAQLKGRDLGLPPEKQGQGLVDALLTAVN